MEDECLLTSFYSGKVDDLTSYLSPNWDLSETDCNWEHANFEVFKASEGTNPQFQISGYDVDSITTEILSFVKRHTLAYHGTIDYMKSQDKAYTSDKFDALESIQENMVSKQGQENVAYCRKLIKWLITRMTTIQLNATRNIDSNERLLAMSILTEVNQFFSELISITQEYLSYAPGPWREVVFIEFLFCGIIPKFDHYIRDLLVNLDVSKSSDNRKDALDLFKTPFLYANLTVVESASMNMKQSHEQDGNPLSTTTEGEIGSVSASDDISVSDTQSVSTVLEGGISMGSRDRRGLPPSSATAKKYQQVIQKLKSENNMLRDTLSKTEIADIVLLQTRLRSASAINQKLRQLNSDLKDRVQVLEYRLYDALNSGSKDLHFDNSGPQENAEVVKSNKSGINGSDESGNFVIKQSDSDEGFQDAIDDQSIISGHSIRSRNPDPITDIASSYTLSHSSQKYLSKKIIERDSVLDRSLINRNRHLEKLVCAYEQRIRFLESTSSFNTISSVGEKYINSGKSVSLTTNNSMPEGLLSDTNLTISTVRPEPTSESCSAPENTVQTKSKVSQVISSEDGLEEIMLRCVKDDLSRKTLSEYIYKFMHDNRQIDRKTIEELLKELQEVQLLRPIENLKSSELVRGELENSALVSLVGAVANDGTAKYIDCGNSKIGRSGPIGSQNRQNRPGKSSCTNLNDTKSELDVHHKPTKQFNVDFLSVFGLIVILIVFLLVCTFSFGFIFEDLFRTSLKLIARQIESLLWYVLYLFKFT